MLYDIQHTSLMEYLSFHGSPGDVHSTVLSLFSDPEPQSGADHGDPETSQEQLLLLL